MDPLMARYLDGDLNEDEVTEFLAVLATEPEAEAELEALERAVELVASTPCPGPSRSFTPTIMDAVRAQGRVPNRRPRLGISLSLAAVLLVGLGLGFTVGTRLPSDPMLAAGHDPTPGLRSTVPDGWAADPARALPLRMVRLIYTPDDPAVARVAVAGSFNSWDPATTPMRRQNGVWAAWLLLPADVYEYQFVVDGDRWVTDPLAPRTRPDGFGGTNAVLDLDL